MDMIAQVLKIQATINNRQSIFSGVFSVLINLSQINLLMTVSSTLFKELSKQPYTFSWLLLSLAVWLLLEIVNQQIYNSFIRKLNRTNSILRQLCFRDEARSLKYGDISKTIAKLNGKKARNKREG